MSGATSSLFRSVVKSLPSLSFNSRSTVCQTIGIQGTGGLIRAFSVGFSPVNSLNRKLSGSAGFGVGAPTILNLIVSSQSGCFISVRQKHNKIRDLRVGYNFLRERPYGPQKHKPPNLIDSRVARTIDYRKIVHYPPDGKYTTKKLDMTKLGGRHPVTGRKVIEGVGGGSKRKYRWIDNHRLPPSWPRDGSVYEERVISINYDPNRDSKIALTGHGDNLRWQIATDKMKEGDLLRTFSTIPNIPVRPTEGDSHPLGALPVGTHICQVESWPGEGAFFMVNADESAQILRKVKDRVVIKCWDRLEFSIPQEAQCVVGKNSIHPLRAMAIGSPNRMRWLGIRPRSGLWKRKTGRHGRKIKKPPPTIETTTHEEYMRGVGTPSSPGFKGRSILCDALSEGSKGRMIPKKKKITDQW